MPHQEAPTAICWGDRNRSVLVRVPLGWLGVQPAEGIYVLMARLAAVVYFAFFLLADTDPRSDLERWLPFLKAETRRDVVYLVTEFVDILVAFFDEEHKNYRQWNTSSDISEAARCGKPLSLVMVDVDDFSARAVLKAGDGVVAGAKVVRQSGDDGIDARDEAGGLALRHQLPHHAMRVEPLVFRNLARSEDVGDDHRVGRAERTGDKDAEAMISLLIPVLKGFLTDKGYDMTVQAQQVYGGHGYIEEWGMSQFTRDARIAMIYEGANGVQALDLVGRKLMDGGEAAYALLDEIEPVSEDEQSYRPIEELYAWPLALALLFSLLAALTDIRVSQWAWIRDGR